MSQQAFEEGNLIVEAYFSLSHKAVLFDETVSKSSRQKITGFKNSTSESFVLIGQLGKRMTYDANGELNIAVINAKEIIDTALAVIQMASSYIVNKYIIIECKPISKIKKIYEKYGFTELQYNKKDKLYALYLKVKNTIDF